jgi:putative serine protease PepD
MSENDMNEQPEPRPGNQPAASDPSATDPTNVDAEHAWRPPSEPTSGPTPPAAMPTASNPTVPVEPTVPASPAPSQPMTPLPGTSQPATPYVTGRAPEEPPAGYPTAGHIAGDYPASGVPAAAPATEFTPGVYPPASGDATTGFPTAGGYPTSTYPSYAEAGTHEAKPQRGRKVGAVAGIAGLALLLALGGGVAGGAIMHSLDKDDRVTVSRNGVVVDNAPIIDRSSLASIASKVSPSVVSITTQSAEGSGVVLSADGYILTNNHVAATASGQTVDVTFTSGNTVKATLVGTDPKTDLAVYKAEGVSGLAVASFGDSAALQVGDTVLAIGSPLGLDGSVSAGIVSALNRTIDESSDSSPQDPFGQGQQSQNTSPTATIAGAIQTDAAINPGNSGGALVNTNGQVVGINTAIATNGADGNIGVGFAIPSNRAKQVADSLIKGVKISHPQLGVGVTTADDNAGAVVGSVTAGSAADKGGIKVGDVITAFDGKAVHTSDDLLNDVQSGTVGKTVSLSITRSGAAQTVNVTLGEAK